MKTLYNILAGTFIVSFLLTAAGGCASKKIPASDKAKAVSEMINSKSYVFKAEYALPRSGASRNLTPDYDLTVSPDTIISDLPFFGRAYTAPIDPTKGGFKFTSTDFEYTFSERRKGGWQVSIKPNDTRDVQQLTLDISENGYASLRVISNSREPMAFNGYITERKNRK